MPTSPFTPEQISQILEEFFKTVGTRQYIGARYVPIFGRKGEASIQWDNTAPYEPLTIVQYQGNTYTSRQFVPIGVDINNALYWAETGNYSAQIEQYRQEVLRFDGRITDNADAIETLTNTTDTQTEQLAGNTDSGLKTLIGNNADAIDNIEQSLRRVAVYIGNSYTLGVGDTGPEQGIFARTKKYLFDDAYMFVSSGAGFTNHSSSMQFTALIDNARDSLDFENSEVTDVIFVAAAGEQISYKNVGPGTYKNDLNTALRECVTKAFRYFPNLKHCRTVLAEAQQHPFNESGGQSIPPKCTFFVHQFMKNLCNQIPAMEYMGWIGWEIQYKSEFFYDEIHPNPSGYAVLAASFIEAYRGTYKPSTRGTRFRQFGAFGFASGKLDAIWHLFSDGERSWLKLEQMIPSSDVASNVPSNRVLSNHQEIVFYSETVGAVYEVIPIPTISALSESNETIGVFNWYPNPTVQNEVVPIRLIVSYDNTAKVVRLLSNGWLPAEGYAPAMFASCDITNVTSSK